MTKTLIKFVGKLNIKLSKIETRPWKIMTIMVFPEFKFINSVFLIKYSLIN